MGFAPFARFSWLVRLHSKSIEPIKLVKSMNRLCRKIFQMNLIISSIDGPKDYSVGKDTQRAGLLDEEWVS